jgi:hypothetical protein
MNNNVQNIQVIRCGSLGLNLLSFSLVHQIFMQKLALSLGFTSLAKCSCLLVFCVSEVGESHMDTTSYLQFTLLFPSLCFIIMFS